MSTLKELLDVAVSDAVVMATETDSMSKAIRDDLNDNHVEVTKLYDSLVTHIQSSNDVVKTAVVAGATMQILFQCINVLTEDFTKEGDHSKEEYRMMLTIAITSIIENTMRQEATK